MALSQRPRTILMSNLSADDTNDTGTYFPGGLATLVAIGTFGGGTLKLQLQGPDDSTWVDVTDASFTAAGSVNVLLGPVLVRGHFSGSSGASGVYLSLTEGM